MFMLISVILYFSSNVPFNFSFDIRVDLRIGWQEVRRSTMRFILLCRLILRFAKSYELRMVFIRNSFYTCFHIELIYLIHIIKFSFISLKSLNRPFESRRCIFQLNASGF